MPAVTLEKKTLVHAIQSKIVRVAITLEDGREILDVPFAVATGGAYIEPQDGPVIAPYFLTADELLAETVVEPA